MNYLEHNSHGAWRQAGRCTYCACGRRLYQGRAPKTQEQQTKLANELLVIVAAFSTHPCDEGPCNFGAHGQQSRCTRVGCERPRLGACQHTITAYDDDRGVMPDGRVASLYRCLLCGTAYDRLGFLLRFQREIRDRLRMRPLKFNHDEED